MATRGGLIILHMYSDSIADLSDKDAGQLLKALMAYSVDGTDVKPSSKSASPWYNLLKQSVDENRKRYEATCTRNRNNGGKGGRPKIENNKKENPQEPTGFLEEPSDNPQEPTGFLEEPSDNPQEPKKTKYKDKDKYKDKYNISISDDIDIEDIGDSEESPTPPPKKEKTIRHKYGSYGNVLLSDDDYNKLMQEFPTDYNNRIERLSEYIAMKNPRYTNHLAAIRTWARRDDEKSRGSPQRKHSSGDELLDKINSGYFKNMAEEDFL